MAISTLSLSASTLDRPNRSYETALAAVRAAADNKGKDIVVLDMRGQTAIFDYFVIVTVATRRQLHAMSEEIDHVIEKQLGDHRLGIEGYEESHWILLDYGDVVIHLFDENTRKYYDLESLWGDATRVDLAGVIPA